MGMIDAYYIPTANQGDFQRRLRVALTRTAIAVMNEVADEKQTVTITGSPTGGTFTLNYAGQVTAAIAWNAPASTVQAALQLLSTIGNGNCIVTGGPLPATAMVIRFTGTLAALPLNLVIAVSSLTGGASPAVTPTRTTAGVSVEYHAGRASLANRVLFNIEGYLPIFSYGVTDNATIQTDYSPAPNYPLAVSAATVDADIANQVSAIWNSYI